MTEACRVSVRLRPLLKGESKANDRLLLDDGSVKFHRQGVERLYSVDRTFVPSATQEDVFTSSVAPIIPTVLQGIHSTIFAYGQTGSGKTFTMQGLATSSGNLHTSSGVIPRAIQRLFSLRARDNTHSHTIKLSCFQVYCEHAYDLLKEPRYYHGSGVQRSDRMHSVAGLRMRMNAEGSFYLENLTEVTVDSVAEALALYNTAMSHKTVATHDMNVVSSRSHVVLQLSVTSAPIAAKDEQRRANLVLVDLAGCERQDLTGIQPTPRTPEDDAQHQDISARATQVESIAINKSLMVLRQVIAARSAFDSAKGNGDSSVKNQRSSGLTHVPYRDSKLTSLLKSGLSGSGRMVMIACIAPSQQHAEGTMSSLEYACLARRICNKAKVNEGPHTFTIRKLRAEIGFLKQQLSAAQHSSDVKSLVQTVTVPDLASGVGSLADIQPFQRIRSSCDVVNDYGQQHGELTGSTSEHTESGTHQDGSQATWQHGDDSSQQPVQKVSGPSNGVHCFTETGSQCLGAGIQTAEVEVGTQATADMDPIEKGLSPGHTLTKELVDKIVRYAEVSKALKRSHDQLAEANSQLRTRFLKTDEELANLRTAMTTCESENVELRELATLLSSAVKGVEGRMLTPSDLFSLGRGVLWELQELRQENSLLHSHLHKLSYDSLHPHQSTRPLTSAGCSSGPDVYRRFSMSRGGGTAPPRRERAATPVTEPRLERKAGLAAVSSSEQQIVQRPKTVGTACLSSEQSRGCFTYPGGQRERTEVLRRLQLAKNFSNKVNSKHASVRKDPRSGQSTKTRPNSRSKHHQQDISTCKGGEYEAATLRSWVSQGQFQLGGEFAPLAGSAQRGLSGSEQEWRGLGSGAHMHAGPVLLSTTGKLTHGGLMQHVLDIHSNE